MLGYSAISEIPISEVPGNLYIFPSGAAATTSVGSESVKFGSEVTVTGGYVTTSVGSEYSVTGTAVISLTGISATLSVGNVIVWQETTPAPGTTYSALTPSSDPTWSTVSTGASQTWTEKVA